MTSDDIERALEVATSASEGKMVWSTLDASSQQEAMACLDAMHRDGPDPKTHTVCIEDGTTTPLCIAVTGNGPTSAANARYIAGSFDPVAGWAAALRECRRLKRLLAAEIGNGPPLRHA